MTARANKTTYAIGLFLCFTIFLSGCAGIQIKKSSAYAENLYKRIPYTEDGKYRTIKMFYATTRQIEKSDDQSVCFNNKMADNLTLGELSVNVDPAIKVGKMKPARLKRRGMMGVQDALKLDNSEFIEKLKHAVEESPHHSLLVIIFGYNDDFENTAFKAAFFSYLLDVNTPVLLFDWPGDQYPLISGYKKARAYAISSGPYLGSLITNVIREVKPDNLWIKSSSLGCQIFCDALDYMHKEDDLSDFDAEISHVIMAAPDVGENEFDHKFKDKIASMSKHMTTYVASGDTALLMSDIINHEKRLGRIDPIKYEQLEETKDILYLRSLDPDKISLVDVTPIDHASYKHGYYLESPEFYNDLYTRLFNDNPNVNRCLYLFKVHEGADYWVLRGSER